MKVRRLGQVWAAWGGWPHVAKDIPEFKAFLGDGSEITAVGRSRGGICEVHSERGIEHHDSMELVVCEELE